MINWDQATKSFCFTVRDSRPETVSVLSFHATRWFREIGGRRREPRGTAGSLLPRPVGHGVRRRVDQLQHSGGVPTAGLQVLWWRIGSQRCNAPVPVWLRTKPLCALVFLHRSFSDRAMLSSQRTRAGPRASEWDRAPFTWMRWAAPERSPACCCATKGSGSSTTALTGRMFT